MGERDSSFSFLDVCEKQKHECLLGDSIVREMTASHTVIATKSILPSLPLTVQNDEWWIFTKTMAWGVFLIVLGFMARPSSRNSIDLKCLYFRFCFYYFNHYCLLLFCVLMNSTFFCLLKIFWKVWFVTLFFFFSWYYFCL